MSDIASRVREVKERIAAAAARSGRSYEDVTLVAVAKTRPASDVVVAARAGVTDFGENRAQELIAKVKMVEAPVRWHFVGTLQSNKVRHVVGTVELVHSVDELELAQTIARRAVRTGVQQEVLIEVNLSGEASKSGTVPEGALDLARKVDELEGVVVRGLMTIPAFPESPDESRPAYRELCAMGNELRADLPAATHLSMGMTRDFEVAIEEGATIVRVGEAIFGPRARS